MARIDNNTDLKESEFEKRFGGLGQFGGLKEALDWAKNANDTEAVPEVITQDEFTHDVIFDSGGCFVVFDTT